MAPDDLLGLDAVARLLDSADVQGAVLAIEAADTAHIIAVVSKLVAGEAVLGRFGKRGVGVGERMEELALPAVRAAPAREEDTDVFHPCRIGAGKPCVAFEGAAGLGFSFTALRERRQEEVGSCSEGENSLGVAVLAVSSRPFVVPDICFARRKVSTRESSETNDEMVKRTVLLAGLRGVVFLNFSRFHLLPRWLELFSLLRCWLGRHDGCFGRVRGHRRARTNESAVMRDNVTGKSLPLQNIFYSGQR
jgi:hypothetical protein